MKRKTRKRKVNWELVVSVIGMIVDVILWMATRS